MFEPQNGGLEDDVRFNWVKFRFPCKFSGVYATHFRFEKILRDQNFREPLRYSVSTGAGILAPKA